MTSSVYLYSRNMPLTVQGRWRLPNVRALPFSLLGRVIAGTAY